MTFSPRDGSPISVKSDTEIDRIHSDETKAAINPPANWNWGELPVRKSISTTAENVVQPPISTSGKEKEKEKEKVPVERENTGILLLLIISIKNF